VILPDKIDDNNNELIKAALNKLVEIQRLYSDKLEKSHEDFCTRLEQICLEKSAGGVAPAIPEFPAFHDISEEAEHIRICVEGVFSVCEEIRNKQELEIYNRQQEFESLKNELSGTVREVEGLRNRLESLQKLEEDNAEKIAEHFRESGRRNKKHAGMLIPIYVGLVIAIVLSAVAAIGGN
jgi:tetrahydromethanopterin S-methyltransferase subunit G